MVKKPGHFNRTVSHPSSTVSVGLVIAKGVLVSFIASFILATIFSFTAALSDHDFLESYQDYLIAIITMTGIFIGSMCAAKRAESKGLLIGVTVGAVYMLISVAIGAIMNGEFVAPMLLGSKLAAAGLAGMLGGFIGVNL